MITATTRVNPPNRERVELSTLLELVPSNSFRWLAFNFQGVVGVAPQGLWVEDFERISKSSNFGYIFDWPNLLLFAKKLEDLYDCVLVATDADSTFSKAEVALETWTSAKLVLELFDSSEWTVRIRDESSFPQLVAKCKSWNVADQ
jgi:hypothetical protein